MWHSIKVYLIVLPIFLLVDYLWLGVIMSGFYKGQLGDMARRAGSSLTPNIWAAVIVYLLIPLGIILFVLPRAATGGFPQSPLLWGFLFGIVLYGVYDMTNYSILKAWPLKLALVDILWGGVLNASMSLVAALVDRGLE
jgi:uncharacterized membrane protein